MSIARTQSPDSLSARYRRLDTIGMVEMEGGRATPVTSHSKTKDVDVDETLSSDTEGVSQHIYEQASTTPGHRNDESWARARAPVNGVDSSSGNPNLRDNAAERDEDLDSRENGTKADLTCVYLGSDLVEEVILIITEPYSDRLPPKVEDFKRSLELALQVGAVSVS
ncbi:hypothetical protein PQX77_007174 [Marasmius sp. AFHP31]|nr:hypothetical protein PQX77_007174 [Marasmius sp. AFHP31]